MFSYKSEVFGLRTVVKHLHLFIIKIIFILFLVALTLSLTAQGFVSLEPDRITTIDFWVTSSEKWQIRNAALATIRERELKWDDLTDQKKIYVYKYSINPAFAGRHIKTFGVNLLYSMVIVQEKLR